MCGICGLVALDGGRVDASALRAMNASLAHRGPDSEGLRVVGPAGLAMRRLSIIDLEGGDQPIANEDGTVHVVLNGEIYNYRELRARLAHRGHRFSTRSDTEVLVHLYEDHGPELVHELRGMFAFAIWDAPRRRLVLARDPFGIKPLHYRRRGATLAFASELKALARLQGFSRELDLAALDAYLAFNAIPAPRTIFAEARKLPAGSLLVAESGGLAVRRYARPRPVAAGAVRRERPATLAAELRERLRDSVRAHLTADVPVGVLLSGGVDSSTLTALASAEAGRVSTFSVGFREAAFDELEAARRVARRFGTDHHEVVLEPRAADLLPRLAEAFDEPYANSSALPTWAVSELAAGHVKVVLSGEGADELFGGYYTYVADLLAPRLAPLGRLALPLVERLPSSAGKVPLEYKAKRFARAAHLPALERHHGWKEIFSADARAELLAGPREGAGDPLEPLARAYAETEGAEPLARLQDVDVAVPLVDDLLTRTDRASMAHGLEVRVPFLDPAVAELALALPADLKVRGLSKKRLLRRAAAPLVGSEVVRARKQGFSIPAAAWLRGELEPFARDVLSPAAVRRQGIFRPEAVTRLLDRHVARQDDLSRQIWGLLAFALWHERFGQRPASAARAA